MNIYLAIVDFRKACFDDIKNLCILLENGLLCPLCFLAKITNIYCKSKHHLRIRIGKFVLGLYLFIFLCLCLDGLCWLGCFDTLFLNSLLCSLLASLLVFQLLSNKISDLNHRKKKKKKKKANSGNPFNSIELGGLFL